MCPIPVLPSDDYQSLKGHEASLVQVSLRKERGAAKSSLAHERRRTSSLVQLEVSSRLIWLLVLTVFQIELLNFEADV